MTTAPYGTWESPITAELAAGSSNVLLGLQLDGQDLYWLEMRPNEGGRYVLMRQTADGGEVVTPPDFNVRTRVHEYGGLSFLAQDGIVYFCNFADQALYRVSFGGAPEPLSKSDDVRFAELTLDTARDRLICIREDHRGNDEAANSIVAVGLDTPNDGTVLWQGSDFVAYPSLSPDGSQLAWTSWDHPNMPWDNVSLWLADVADDGGLVNIQQINEGVDESVMQPSWSPDGDLYFLADRSGWWNLHQLQDDGVHPVHHTDAELGGPLWNLGTRWYDIRSNTEAVVEFGNADSSGLARLDLTTGDMTTIELPYASFSSIASRGDQLYILAGREDGPGQLVKHNLSSNMTVVLHHAGDDVVADGYLSRGEAITFPTPGGGEAYGYYYPPVNTTHQAPDDELPPLIVLMHGGPTSATSKRFSIAIQFWTSRGFAIVDVNYRGSTGYGRVYRQQLNEQWGVVDIEDAVAATEYLVAEGKADPDRLLIRGGSAGGYTTLAALAFTDVFAAGANYYGVSDLAALAEHTHKFESRYLDSMVGPYPAAADVYAARSPINALDGFNAPLITFQGLEDQVVPPAQSEEIFKALKKKGTATAYVPFEGEQHGFRSAANNITALQSELYFYGRVLGFTPHGDLPNVAIENLPT
ncbi:MAG: prolyl oligopeptidase family serine peptidase [Pseudomonadota bacterium]